MLCQTLRETALWGYTQKGGQHTEDKLFVQGTKHCRHSLLHTQRHPCFVISIKKIIEVIVLVITFQIFFIAVIDCIDFVGGHTRQYNSATISSTMILGHVQSNLVQSQLCEAWRILNTGRNGRTAAIKLVKRYNWIVSKLISILWDFKQIFDTQMYTFYLRLTILCVYCTSLIHIKYLSDNFLLYIIYSFILLLCMQYCAWRFRTLSHFSRKRQDYV